MKITSRVVIVKGDKKGQTGTVVEYLDDSINVMLDSGKVIGCNSSDVVEIDDITGIGNIEFKKGMKIYDIELNMVGVILAVEQLDGDLQIYNIRFENGIELKLPLFEESNFIVIEDMTVKDLIAKDARVSDDNGG